MWAAEQLDLARDIRERGLDLLIVRRRLLPLNGERSDLQKIEPPIVADGKFHVDGIA